MTHHMLFFFSSYKDRQSSQSLCVLFTGLQKESESVLLICTYSLSNPLLLLFLPPLLLHLLSLNTHEKALAPQVLILTL